MKKLEALIGPDAIDGVVEMLEQRNISNLTITDVAAKDPAALTSKRIAGMHTPSTRIPR
jgi:hypothetical protein